MTSEYLEKVPTGNTNKNRAAQKSEPLYWHEPQARIELATSSLRVKRSTN